MQEREEIREFLLEEEGFETVQKDSFGSSILAKTKEELDTLSRKLDSYITSFAEEFGSYLRNEFIERIRNDSDENSDIESVISKRKYNLDMIQSLRKQVGKCRSPEDFVKVVKVYIQSSNLTYDGTKMDYVEARNHLLNRYSSFSTKHKSTKSFLSPANWQNGLKGAEKAIENEYLYQSMLQETFLRLREYHIEKRKLPLGDDPEASDPESLIDPKNVIIELNLATYACLEFNKDKVEEFNEIVVRTFTRDQKNIRCDKNMLIIIDKFVFVSDVQEQLSRCSFVDSIVLLAADTVIIDSDLDAKLLEGRNVMILAPQWLVPGKRSLMVSGKPHEEKQEKAGFGEVGLDGKDGNPSGSFLGIGQRFQGIEDLTVQACGGNGQDGQDGGDGRDGTDGVDNALTSFKNEKEVHVPIIYNVETSVKKKEGTQGTAGQDSGAGGKGGKGGAKGSINIVDLVHHGKPSSSFRGLGFSSRECEGRQGLPGADGKPGESGSNGCTTIETTKAHEIFGKTFDVFSSTDTQKLPCNRTTPKGEVLRETRINLYVPRQRDSLPPVCKMFDRLMMFIDDSRYYSSKLTVKSIEAFRNNVKEKLCS
ncbi:uncharacterized protein LOC111053979 isoform X1 [Nilaparvata lugens]|uniref:uncharacterized protein LOC111053979 isoform X1 n=1 Tax=Nilaparvata lugens TaxID=108931 RepID=UPI00193C9337|nr:uncharacterized protein LOC111053979 isoform X1 [Nilaparvata lugens]